MCCVFSRGTSRTATDVLKRFPLAYGGQIRSIADWWVTLGRAPTGSYRADPRVRGRWLSWAGDGPTAGADFEPTRIEFESEQSDVTRPDPTKPENEGESGALEAPPTEPDPT